MSEKLNESVMPNFDKPGMSYAPRVWFWVGTFPTIECAEVTLGGTTFPRTHETVKPREGNSPSIRTPHIGQPMHLSQVQIEAIKEQLRRSFYRFFEPPRPILTTGEGIEALEQKSRRGNPIRVRTDKEIAERLKSELPTTPFATQQWDEPLACHVFAVLCVNQDRPRSGVEYPRPLSETGLEWPVNIAAEVALMD
jgi:hypothetical protein